MAPKKKPQKNQTNSKAYTSSIPNSSHKKPSKVPKLLISPEDEDSLRRLLLSFRRTASPVRAPVRNSLISTGNSLAKSFQMIRLNSTLSSLRVTLTIFVRISVNFLHFSGRFLIRCVCLCLRMVRRLRVHLIGSV